MTEYEFFSALLPLFSPFEIINIEKRDTKVHIYLEVNKAYPNPKNCIKHQYYTRVWEHLPLFEYSCFLHCKIPIYKDKETGKTAALKIAFSRKNSRFTLLFEQQIMDLIKIHYCIKKVAKQLKINAQRVSDIYHFYTQEAYENHEFMSCQNIGIDETSSKKGHNYISLIVDLDQGKIINIQNGKGADVIANFYNLHPNPALIQNISVDMSPSFKSGIDCFFPDAKITFDKWHVFKLMSKHLRNIGKVKKNKDKKGYIPVLNTLLRHFYQLENFERAKSLLVFIADWAEYLFDKNSFSKSIRRHFDGIVEHIRSKITNGILEGINSKVQTIKRVCKGFRYTESFKKIILFAFGIIKPRKFT